MVDVEISKIERIICGDNLEVLKTIESESVDLCYIDPPFFSGRNYAVIFGDTEEVRQFDDRWIKMNEKGKYTKDINVYLAFMEPRIKEIHRVLKPTGSFYLHCDKHASHYLKILCDHIFEYNRFINEIIWHYSGTGNPSKNFKQKHDNILFYSKTKKYTFNPIKEMPTNPSTIKRYNKIDENGKKYKTWNTKGVIRKVYMKELMIDDVWNMSVIGATSKERLGYPTQKPESLLERIIKASSNKGDIVLDCFCGCGTSLAVANKLERQFIGIDVSPTSCRLMAKRINLPTYKIEGLPLTVEEISKMSGWEFQNWIVNEFGSNAIQGKKGADGGIDGKIFDTLIQVKKYKAGRNDLDTFSGTLLRENKKEGIYLALEFTSTFKKEVARLNTENGINIHYYSIQDIIENKHHELINRLGIGSYF